MLLRRPLSWFCSRLPPHRLVSTATSAQLSRAQRRGACLLKLAFSFVYAAIHEMRMPRHVNSHGSLAVAELWFYHAPTPCFKGICGDMWWTAAKLNTSIRLLHDVCTRELEHASLLQHAACIRWRLPGFTFCIIPKATSLSPHTYTASIYFIQAGSSRFNLQPGWTLKGGKVKMNSSACYLQVLGMLRCVCARVRVLVCICGFLFYSSFDVRRAYIRTHVHRQLLHRCSRL